MTTQEQIRFLVNHLLAEMPQYRDMAQYFSEDAVFQRRLLRSLMNLREPLPLDRQFLAVQDALLSAETEAKNPVHLADMAPTTADPRVFLWQGDITRLAVDAVVNAANDALLGCFVPCHGCIDNAIHSAAGLELREACYRLMQAQGHPEPVGQAKLTKAYNLPSQYVLHTVGPIIRGAVTDKDRQDLANCYRACLTKAAEQGLHSVAFCCISTGEYHFPAREAAEIAVTEVKAFLEGDTHGMKVIFNAFKDSDDAIYRHLLAAD
jgi:O-acetyl-ADP-ribose deacetylase (regulator of RNase III)